MKTFILGLLVTFGAVGGIETAGPEVSLIPAVALAIVGLTLMYVGTSNIKELSNV